VVDVMLKQHGIKDLGGTMRLGHYDCHITEGSLAHDVFGKLDIKERHRHRWEVNNDYIERLEKAGLKASGVNPAEDLVEIIEMPEHRFFLASQFHPEFQSRPTRPHPMFRSWVQASLDYRHGEDRKED